MNSTAHAFCGPTPPLEPGLRAPRTHHWILICSGARGSIRTWSYPTCPHWPPFQTLVLSHCIPIARGHFWNSPHHQSPDLQLPRRSPSSPLPCSSISRDPQLQRSSPASATQHQHPGVETTRPPLQRPFTHQDAGVQLPHRLHSSTSTGPIFRQPSIRQAAPGRCLSLHLKGTAALSHHWTGQHPSL